MRSLFVLVCTIAAITATIPTLSGYAHSVDLTYFTTDGSQNVNRTFILYYTVNSSRIDIGIVANVAGPTDWISFGVTPNTDLQTSVPSDVGKSKYGNNLLLIIYK